MYHWITLMKRSIILSTLVFLLLAPAAAQQSSDVEFVVGSGYVIPASPMAFSKYWNMQYGGGAGVGIAVSPSVTAFCNAEYYRFTLNESGVSKGFDTPYMRDIWAFNDVSVRSTAGPSSVLSVSANVRISPSAPAALVSPFLTVGAGVMHLSMGEISIPATSVLVVNGSTIAMTAEQKITGGSETSPIVQAGAGLDVRLTEALKFFVEARYAHGFSKGLGTSYVPVTAGIKFRL